MKTELESNIKEEIKERIAGEKSCPLCASVLDFEFDQISHLQYEVTISEETRKQVAKEGGFCDFHFRQFKKLANGKTNILLLKSLIEEGAYKKKDFVAECRICRNLISYEAKLCETFAELLTREEIRNIFENNNGICFIHLSQVNNRLADESIKDWLNRTHIQQIERMQGDFDFMNRFKSFYEIDREKRSLINILIEKLAGRKTGAL